MEALTGRQWQIATLISRGLTNAQIGAELGLSRGTVANHVRHIMKRLYVGSRVEIAVWTVLASADRSKSDVRGSGANSSGALTSLATLEAPSSGVGRRVPHRGDGPRH